MYCITSFKVNICMRSEDEKDSIINLISLDTGMTEDYLFIGLIKKETDDIHYKLFEQINETLSIIIDKKDLLKELGEKFNIRYSLEIKFSDIEKEIENNRSFNIPEDVKSFIEEIGGYINLQSGYFD